MISDLDGIDALATTTQRRRRLGPGIKVCTVPPDNVAPFTKTWRDLSTTAGKGQPSELNFCMSLCFLKWTGRCSAGGYVRPGCLGFYTNKKHGQDGYGRCTEQSQSKKCHAEIKTKGPTSGVCPSGIDLSPNGELCQKAFAEKRWMGMLNADSSTKKATAQEFANWDDATCSAAAGQKWLGADGEGKSFHACLVTDTCGCIDKWEFCHTETHKCPKLANRASWTGENKWWFQHCAKTCDLCEAVEGGGGEGAGGNNP